MDTGKIVKGIVAILIITVTVTVLARINKINSRTLTDYAEANPETAYKTPEPTIEPEKDETQEKVNPMDKFYYTTLTEEIKNYITGVSYPTDDTDAVINYDDLRLLHVLHYNFDGEVAEGEMIINASIADEVMKIFYELYVHKYQIEKIQLIEVYNGDDNLSMADNNSSCFNYRCIAETDQISNHSYGLAIDINPKYNPYIYYNDEGMEVIAPAGSDLYADRSMHFPYKIDETDLAYKLFTANGFTWGGDWNDSKDYQHFEKIATMRN